MEPMPKQLTVVMYHYVRPMENTRFPSLKALSLERFLRQLDHITTNYHPVSPHDLFSALQDSSVPLPEKAILLTFDDGYADHYQYVLPALKQRDIVGCFFPPAEPVLQHHVLDVNKIQFTLAVFPRVDELLSQTFQQINAYRADFDLPGESDFRARIREQHRYDQPETILFKRLLQRELPLKIRHEIVHHLFTKYVAEDESSFASELYMSESQLRIMIAEGMHIGCHGSSHEWLNHLAPDEQASEVDHSIRFLKVLYSEPFELSMCYPYGGFNSSLLDLLRLRGFRAGFSVEPRVADLAVEDPLLLPRLDTNDLPS